MSKNNMLLGYARGKVGSLVFSRLKGQQITKAHNASPANPKTYNQMLQRVVLASGVALFKLAQSKFFKFAFEDKKATESDYNAFIRKNIMNFPYVEKADVKAGYVPVGNMIVSSGSLGAINAVVPTGANVQTVGNGKLAFTPAEVSALFANLAATDTNIGAVSAKIIANSGNRLQDGDLITLVAFVCEGGGEEPTAFAYSQLKLDSASTALLSADAAGLLQVGQFGETASAIYMQTGFLYTDVEVASAIALGLIVTRKEGSAILSSDSVLAYNDTMNRLYADKIDDAAKLAAARSYGATQSAILNPEKI